MAALGPYVGRASGVWRRASVWPSGVRVGVAPLSSVPLWKMGARFGCLAAWLRCACQGCLDELPPSPPGTLAARCTPGWASARTQAGPVLARADRSQSHRLRVLPSTGGALRLWSGGASLVARLRRAISVASVASALLAETAAQSHSTRRPRTVAAAAAARRSAPRTSPPLEILGVCECVGE